MEKLLELQKLSAERIVNVMDTYHNMGIREQFLDDYKRDARLLLELLGERQMINIAAYISELRDMVGIDNEQALELKCNIVREGTYNMVNGK